MEVSKDTMTKRQDTNNNQSSTANLPKSWNLRFGICLVIVSWLLIFPTLHAQEAELVDPGEGVFTLSLEAVTDIALHNNFDIQLAQFDAQIAQTDLGVAESIYDTIIDAEFNYRNDKLDRKNTFGGTQSIEANYNLGATKKLPTGTTVSLDYTNNRAKTDSSFATINPAYDAALGVTIEQELGKNFFGLSDRSSIKITKLDIENSEYTSLEKIEENLAKVQKAYWELVREIGRVEVERKMVEQSKRLFDLHQEKIKDGLVEPAELFASEANYRRRVNDFLLAENEVKTKQNVLKLLLNLSSDEGISIDPKDNFVLDNSTKQLDLSLRSAFDNRRDYKRAKNDIASSKLNLIMKKNDMWPEVNLTASFAHNGIGSEYRDALSEITNEDHPDLFAGLTVNVPLERTKEKAQLKAAQLEKAKKLVNLKLVERTIATNIINQVKDSNIFKELAVNAQEIARLENEKLTQEEKRFKWGRSDTDTIIRFQEDVIQAELRSLEANFRYYSALVDLRLEENSLLNEYWPPNS